MFTETTNGELSTKHNTKETHKGSINSAYTVMKSSKFSSLQTKALKKLRDLLDKKIYNHKMDLWLNLRTFEQTSNTIKKQHTKSKIEELAACDISGIDLIDDEEEKINDKK